MQQLLLSLKTIRFFIPNTLYYNQINHQKHDNLLYEAHGLKQLQVALHHRVVLHLFRIQLDPLGVDHIASNGKDPIRSR